MTQIFGYHTPHAIVIATDSLALCPDERGGWEKTTVRKIVHVSPSVVMVSGGSGIGLALAHEFAAAVRSQGLWNVEAIFPKALPFARARAPLMHRRSNFAPRPDAEELERYYVLLAGMSLQTDPPSAHWLLMGSESHGAPVERIAMGHVLAIPRHMGFEVRAGRLAGTEGELEAAEKLMEELLRRRAEETQDAAPPFLFLRIDDKGIQERHLS
uniref:Uncharacterized protein n=1 Tax=Desulfacinum infernum TaxID=35837 RepID=A0A831ZRI5_9BACT